MAPRFQNKDPRDTGLQEDSTNLSVSLLSPSLPTPCDNFSNAAMGHLVEFQGSAVHSQERSTGFPLKCIRAIYTNSPFCWKTLTNYLNCLKQLYYIVIITLPCNYLRCEYVPPFPHPPPSPGVSSFKEFPGASVFAMCLVHRKTQYLWLN